MNRLFSRKANSLGLWGDGDEIEAIETAYAISFEGAEAEQLVTMGQLFDPEQFQENDVTVFRLELRKNKEPERFVKNGNALVKAKIGKQGAETVAGDVLWTGLVANAQDAGADPRCAVTRNTTFFSRNAE